MIATIDLTTGEKIWLNPITGETTPRTDNVIDLAAYRQELASKAADSTSDTEDGTRDGA